MRFNLARVFFILSLQIAVPLHACDLRLSAEPIQFDLANYQSAQEATLRVFRSDIDVPGCDQYFITLTSVGNGIGLSGRLVRAFDDTGSESVAYQLYADRNQQRVLTADDGNEAPERTLIGQFSLERLSQSHTLFLGLAATQGSTLRSGDYVDQVRVNLYSGTFDQRQLEQTAIMTITGRVDSRIEIGVSAAGGLPGVAPVIDFGELESGELQRFVIVIEANAGYRLQLGSENSMRLKHRGLEQYIDYQMRVDGATVDLSGAQQPWVAQRGWSGSENSNRFQVDIEIGTVRQKAAGRYQDFITVTAITTE